MAYRDCRRDGSPLDEIGTWRLTQLSRDESTVLAEQRALGGLRRPLRHHVARALRILHQPLGCDPGRDLAGVLDLLPPLEAEGEAEHLDDLLGGRRGQVFGVGFHRWKVTAGVGTKQELDAAGCS